MSEWYFAVDDSGRHLTFWVRMLPALLLAFFAWRWARDEDPGVPESPREQLFPWIVGLLFVLGTMIAGTLVYGRSFLDFSNIAVIAGFMLAACLLVALWKQSEEREPSLTGPLTRRAATLLVLAIVLPIGWLLHALSYSRFVGIEIVADEVRVHYAGLQRTVRLKPSEIETIRLQHLGRNRGIGPDSISPVIVLRNGDKLRGPFVAPTTYEAERRRLDNALAAAEAIEKAPR